MAHSDVFVRDLVNGTTTLVSTTGTASGNSDSSNPVLSADGRYVAFSSMPATWWRMTPMAHSDVFVRDLVNGTTTLVSTTGTASGNSRSATRCSVPMGAMSRFSAMPATWWRMTAMATQDVFVRDLVNGTTTLVSTTGTASGNSAPQPGGQCRWALCRVYSALPATWWRMTPMAHSRCVCA
jgi:hypothetical protein